MSHFTTKATYTEICQRSCANCQKKTTWEMQYVEIDVDQRDSGGIPMRISYGCSECEQNIVSKAIVRDIEIKVSVNPDWQ